MADAVYSACFLHMLLRNGDLVGMANFAPAVNTRGAIFTYENGIVLRTTYHVFDMYANLLGENVLNFWTEEIPLWRVPCKHGGTADIEVVDLIATRHNDGRIAIGAANRHSTEEQSVTLTLPGISHVKVTTLSGGYADDYNDIGRNNCVPFENPDAVIHIGQESVTLILPAHSVNVIEITP